MDYFVYVYEMNIKKPCIWNVMNVESAFGNVMLLFTGIQNIIRKPFLKHK